MDDTHTLTFRYDIVLEGELNHLTYGKVQFLHPLTFGDPDHSMWIRCEQSDEYITETFGGPKSKTHDRQQFSWWKRVVYQPETTEYSTVLVVRRQLRGG